MDEEMKKLLDELPEKQRQMVDAGYVDIQLKVEDPYTHVKSLITGTPMNIIKALGMTLEKVVDDNHLPMAEVLSLIYTIYAANKMGLDLNVEAMPANLEKLVEQIEAVKPKDATWN